MKKILQLLIGTSTITNGILLLTACNASKIKDKSSKEMNNLPQESKSDKIEQLKKTLADNEEKLKVYKNENNNLKTKVEDQNQKIVSLNKTLQKEGQNVNSLTNELKLKENELKLKNIEIEQLKHEKIVLTTDKIEPKIEYLEYMPIKYVTYTSNNPLKIFVPKAENASWADLRSNFEEDVENDIKYSYFLNAKIDRSRYQHFDFSFSFSYNNYKRELQNTINLKKPTKVWIIITLKSSTLTKYRVFSFYLIAEDARV